MQLLFAQMCDEASGSANETKTAHDVRWHSNFQKHGRHRPGRIDGHMSPHPLIDMVAQDSQRTDIVALPARAFSDSKQSWRTRVVGLVMWVTEAGNRTPPLVARYDFPRSRIGSARMCDHLDKQRACELERAGKLIADTENSGGNRP